MVFKRNGGGEKSQAAYKKLLIVAFFPIYTKIAFIFFILRYRRHYFNWFYCIYYVWPLYKASFFAPEVAMNSRGKSSSRQQIVTNSRVNFILDDKM